MNSVEIGKNEWMKSEVNEGFGDNWIDYIKHHNNVIDYLNSKIRNYEEKKVKASPSMTNFYNQMIEATNIKIKELKSHPKRSTSDDEPQSGGRRKSKRRKSKRRKSKRRKSKRRRRN
jgi:hypothetical protein